MNSLETKDPFDSPRHYDRHFASFREDIPFYLDLIKEYGEPVLELACGTGRIAIPLAKEDVDITGLDISGPMLTQARKKAGEAGVGTDFVKADCRDFQLKRKFTLIILPFNTIGLLHGSQNQEALFHCVKRHLKEEGRFVVDFFNPDFSFLTRDPKQRYPVTSYPDPDGRGTVVITENNVYDAAAQLNRVKWYYNIGDGAEEFVKERDIRIFYPLELDAILRTNGFEIERKYGDYDKSAFVSSSPKQLLVCKVED